MLYSILSGILIGTSYIPFPPWASLFCFVPLWIFWSKIEESELSLKASAKRIFFSGWVTQFVLTLIGFNWVTYTVHEFGHLPWWLSFIVFILFSAIAHLYIPLAGLVWILLVKKFKFRKFSKMLIIALILALFESRVLTLFPWNFGYTWMWIKAPLYHVAELIGFQGLSSLTLLFNLGFLMMYCQWQKHGQTPVAVRSFKPLLTSAATVLGLFVALNLLGLYLKNRLPPPDASLNAAIIQPNIGNLEKEQNLSQLYFQENIYAKHEKLTLEAHAQKAEAIDLTVWPETAYPYKMHEGQRTFAYNQIVGLAQTLQGHLITGTYSHSPEQRKMTNSFFIVEPTGQIQLQAYFKTILLAFGEYIPGAEWYPDMKKWIPAGDFARGPGPQVKSINLTRESPTALNIGPQICYESLFPSFTLELARQKADIIVNLTNDSWYGPWQEPYQHLYMTLARGIEVRRPVIRSTNTGISTVMLASGETLEKSPINEPWFGIYKIPYKKDAEATFYQNFPWLIEALLFMTLALILIAGRTPLVRASKS